MLLEPLREAESAELLASLAGPAALQAEARRAIATFAAAADERGLAKAYGLLAALGFLVCRIGEGETAAAEAIGHARLAGDDPTQGWGRGLLAQAAFWGPVPATDGIRRCRALLAQAGGNRRAELAALEALAGLQAMAGEAEAALATADRAVALADDLGANRRPPWRASSPPPRRCWPATRPPPSGTCAGASGSWSARATRGCAPT